MIAILVWTIGLMGSVMLLVVMASMNAYVPHLLLAAFVAILVAVAAYRKNQLELSRGRLSPSKLASINAMYMTILWAWGGIAIGATYLMLPELHEYKWWRKEWWQFVLGFEGAALMSGIFAYLLSKDRDESAITGEETTLTRMSSKDRDESAITGEETTLTRMSRYLAIGQLIAVIATMIGLIYEGKMDFGWVDWSANNIFFCGAAGLAILSWIALSTQKALASE